MTLEEKMFEIIRRRDDDNDYGYAEMVKDIEALFGLTLLKKLMERAVYEPRNGRVILRLMPEEYKELKKVVGKE